MLIFSLGLVTVCVAEFLCEVTGPLLNICTVRNHQPQTKTAYA